MPCFTFLDLPENVVLLKWNLTVHKCIQASLEASNHTVFLQGGFYKVFCVKKTNAQKLETLPFSEAGIPYRKNSLLDSSFRATLYAFSGRVYYICKRGEGKSL